MKHFSKLESLAKEIIDKEASIKKEIENDNKSLNSGDITIEQQKEANRQRFENLRDLCEVFESELCKSADELIGSYAKNNPFIDFRLRVLKSPMASSAIISTYGADRIQQLKNLYSLIQNEKEV